MFLLRKAAFKALKHYIIIFSLCVAIVTSYRHLITKSTRPSEVPQTQPLERGEIPKILWYKLGPRGLNEETRASTDSCIKNNPSYRAVFVTDEAADDYVKKAFTDYPNIIKKYLGLTVPILKADLLRYLLLFDHGGIWFDLDVSCEGTPIDEWVPAPYKDDVGVVVGWEFDMGWTAPIVRQFATWTIMSKPKSPHIWQVIEDILDALELIESNHMPINLITLDVTGDVVNFSGPRRLTRSIYKSLGKILNREIGEDDMSNIIHPTLIGDVLVMPGRSFAAEVNMYEEEETQLPPKLVTHHYAGAWKNEQGGESI